MSIKVGVGGSQGRMGQAVLEQLGSDPNMRCALPVDRSVNVLEALKAASVDVWIDFTVPAAALSHLELCVQYQIPMVLGVTGFSEAEKGLIQAASKKIPMVFSPNFSMGINMLFQLLATAQSMLEKFKKMDIAVDVAIQETHHKHKKDMPSGTSLRMGDLLSLGAEDYACSRIGDIAGEHTVIFALEGERFEMTHRAQNRVIFARGAVVAAKWLMQLKPDPGLYDMLDVLGQKTPPLESLC